MTTKELYTDKQKIFNATGYYADGRYYHYVKNHLGSICLVIDSETDSVLQNTYYSASGVPSSTNLDVQPYLYNGKEFVEAHGLNEYDSQARMYYAPIMRTITMDLFAENYYHISPYAWCGNNPIAFVDPDGSRPLPIDREYNGWTARVDSWFGSRNTGLRGASTYHKGLDFNYSCGGNGDRGTPILATHEGYAHVVDNIDGNAGRYVEITSEDGTVRTRYLHLSAISIEEGQYVLEADNIGKMGGSGKGSETQWTSHLHYEIQKIVDGKWTSIDPTEGRANNLDNILDPQSIIDVDNKLYYGGELPEIVVLNTSIL